MDRVFVSHALSELPGVQRLPSDDPADAEFPSDAKASRNQRSQMPDLKATKTALPVRSLWPPVHALVLVPFYYDGHPHPGMNAAFPAGGPFWQSSAARGGAGLGCPRIDEDVSVAFW
jgi:hypothetical protein